MKAVVVSIDFEKEKVLETWFHGINPARGAENWLEMSGSQLPRYNHYAFADAEARATSSAPEDEAPSSAQLRC